MSEYLKELNRFREIDNRYKIREIKRPIKAQLDNKILIIYTDKGTVLIELTKLQVEAINELKITK